MGSSPPTGDDGVPSRRTVGILTKTVIRSPVVSWLLHARLRHRKLNDVVFVGEDYIHVKQVGADGYLEHIATKDDFDARIRAASIFSNDLESLDEDLVVKPENDDTASGSRLAPPEFVVLTLDTNVLVFLFLAVSSDGRFRFVQQACPMPKFDCPSWEPGERLAVDPQSRALAVAANERQVVIYSAKTGEQIKKELEEADRNWCPVSAEQPIEIEGVILHIDFLIPPSGDENHVILLLIVIDQRKTKAIWIDWYHTSDLQPNTSNLHHAQVHPGQPLDTINTASSLLIPLRNAAFMLITGSEVKLWKDLLSGSATGVTLSPLEAEPKNPGDSPRHPAWVSWCRPRRSHAARRDKDHLYLVREDGLVFLVHAMAETDRIVSSSAGHFECHVGTAFASLNNDTKDPDILAVAGDMSTGRVVSIGHWPHHRVNELSWSDTMAMELIETIPSWASATDLITNIMRHAHGKSARSMHSSASVLVTSGRQPYGSITELRHGFEARLFARWGLESQGLESVTGAWAVPLMTNGSILMFLANPSATRLLSVSPAWEDCGPVELDVSDCSAFDLTHSTLAVNICLDDRIIQVTRQGIFVAAGLNAHFEDCTKRVCDEGDHILAAAILPTQSTVVTAERRGNAHFIRVLYLPAQSEVEGDAPSATGLSAGESSMELESVPTAIAVHQSPSALLVAIATTDGHLLFYQIGNDHAFHKICRTRPPSLQDVPSVSDCLVLLESSNDDRLLATCGLRDGRVYSVVLETDGVGNHRCGDEYTVDFGQSTVRLVHMLDDRSRACALSGANTCLISWNGQDARSMAVNSIWISDKAEPELAQGPVTACAQMPTCESLASPELAGSLVLISGDEILVSILETTPATVPRQIPVRGTPNRLLYAEQQRCLVVASLRIASRSFPTPLSRPEERRQLWPAIEFISPRSSEPSYIHDLRPGDRVYALLEWSFKLSDDKTYSFILVGGSYRKSNGMHGGRITFLQPTNKNWEVIDVKEGAAKRFDAPVYALALYDDRTYVVCFGKYIMLYRFLVQDRKWGEICEPFRLASEGVFVTVTQQLISVSTNQDSFVTLRLCTGKGSDARGGVLRKLVPVSMGPQAHDSLSHLVLQTGERQSVALLSTKHGQLVGLTSPLPNEETWSHSTAADILCEARIPRSLTRLRQGNLRPNWKPASRSGVLVDNIVGTAADGAVVGVALLDEKLWRRLSWLQKLCEWSEELSPHSYQAPMYSVDDNCVVRDERALPIGLATTAGAQNEIVLRTQSSRPLDMHIDGDVLARILEHDGAQTLRQLIRETANRADRVGAWVREHLDEELGAVDDMMDILKRLLEGWI